jgi:hypothetical protein
VSRATPAAVTATERDSAVQEIERFRRRVGDAPVDLDLIPSVKPLLLGVGRSRDGEVWMHLQDSAGRVLHLFGPGGHRVGRVRLPVKPSRWHPIILKGERIHVLTHDSLDVPVVMRLRVDSTRR